MWRYLLRSCLLGLVGSFFAFAQFVSNEPKTAPLISASTASDSITEAGQLFRTGKLDAAGEKYQKIIHDTPNSPDGYAGLTRVYLKQKNLQQAFETISTGLEVAGSAPVHGALGEC